jgi:hypothetical protein
MREPKIHLASLSWWDNFDEIRYSNYLKAIQNVENTLSGIHWRSMEDIRKDCASRNRVGSSEDEQPLGKVNN